jgi:S-(hydroxymethyl)glutathione dehydrogenase/alcohol dehydrogenase
LELIGGPADYAFECVGSTTLAAQALGMVNPYWGVCIAVGLAQFDKMIEIPASAFYFGRSLKGTFLGDGNPLTDPPRILEWYKQGKLKLDELVTHRLPLSEINEGFELMKRGESLRSVIIF